MFELNPIGKNQYNIFRYQFGLYAAVMVGLLLGDRSLGYVFGNEIYIAAILGVVSACAWAANYFSKFFALIYILSLMLIVETNQSALRVMPGYVGWIFLSSLFISTKNINDKDWKFPKDIHLMLVLTLGFSFSFSGLTKIFSELWRSGFAIDYYFSNVRFNWELKEALANFPILLKSLNYLTIAIELFFLPLYLFKKTRKFSWYSLLALFFGTLILMKIYVVSIGIISVLVILYPADNKN